MNINYLRHAEFGMSSQKLCFNRVVAVSPWLGLVLKEHADDE